MAALAADALSVREPRPSWPHARGPRAAAPWWYRETPALVAALRSSPAATYPRRLGPPLQRPNLSGVEVLNAWPLHSANGEPRAAASPPGSPAPLLSAPSKRKVGEEAALQPS